MFIALHRHLEYDWCALLAVRDVHADLSLSLRLTSGEPRLRAIRGVEAAVARLD